MTLADLSWQLNGGPVLNDDSGGLPFVDITNVTGFDSSPYRETQRDHEGTDGAFLDAEFETGRDIVLEGTIYGDVETVAVYLDRLKQNFAPVQTPIPLVFKLPGVNERVVYVKPRGVRYNLETILRTGMVAAQFMMFAEDPRMYDDTLIGVSVPLGGPATTGFGFNFGFNLSFGAVVPVTGASVVVTGNRPTPAIMTITGPVTNPRIMNLTDSHELDFVITLGATDTLVIDLANRTVTLNGNTNARNTLQQPDWWLFNPGTTSVVFGATGSGTLVIQYRNAWR